MSEVFGDYLLEQRIAAGGMAEIFKAQLQGSGGFRKTVAVKRILPQHETDREYVTMLLDEARLIAHLDHPGIVRVLHCGTVDGRHYIAMEYVDGVTLANLLDLLARQRRCAPRAVAVHIARAVLVALDHSHRARDDQGRPLQLVHRDVSPQNVLLSRRGEVKLTDFGVALARDRLSRTATGVLKGKLAYMAPEQVEAGRIDHRADQYAAAIVLFELLCCERAYRGEREIDVLKAVARGEVDDLQGRLQRAGTPPALQAVIRKALSRDPARRHESCGAMADALLQAEPLPTEAALSEALAALVDEVVRARRPPPPPPPGPGLVAEPATRVLASTPRPLDPLSPATPLGPRALAGTPGRQVRVEARSATASTSERSDRRLAEPSSAASAYVGSNRVRILTNPGSNIDEAIRARYDIVLLPQQIGVDGDYFDTRRPITHDTVDDWIRRAKRHPHVIGTSAAEFTAAFQEALQPQEPLLAIMTSRKVISSYDSALTARSTLEKLQGSGLPRIEVVDSRCSDTAAALLVLLACQAREAGLTVERMAGVVEAAAAVQQVALTVETLDNLVKGGRASFLRAWLADFLNVRPMISFVDGALSSVGRYALRDDRTDHIVEFLRGKVGASRRVWASIAHGGDTAAAARLLGKLRAAFAVEYAYVRPLSASIYLHSGRGALAASVLPLEGLPWQPPPPALCNALHDEVQT